MGTYPNIKFYEKAIYEIKVNGKLDNAWVKLFDGMNIDVIQVSENRFISTLTGLIYDQAALSGILNSLYDRHFTVVSVKCIEKYK